MTQNWQRIESFPQFAHLTIQRFRGRLKIIEQQSHHPIVSRPLKRLNELFDTLLTVTRTTLFEHGRSRQTRRGPSHDKMKTRRQMKWFNQLATPTADGRGAAAQKKSDIAAQLSRQIE